MLSPQNGLAQYAPKGWSITTTKHVAKTITGMMVNGSGESFPKNGRNSGDHKRSDVFLN